MLLLATLKLKCSSDELTVDSYVSLLNPTPAAEGPDDDDCAKLAPCRDRR